MKTNLIITSFIVGLIAFGLFVIHEYPERLEVNVLKEVQANILSDNSVIIKGNKFYPDIIAVRIGQTVTWINDDTAGYLIIFDQAVPPVTGIAGNIAPIYFGEKYSLQFTRAGDFSYYCADKPDMKGRVVVVE